MKNSILFKNKEKTGSRNPVNPSRTKLNGVSLYLNFVYLWDKAGVAESGKRDSLISYCLLGHTSSNPQLESPVPDVFTWAP